MQPLKNVRDYWNLDRTQQQEIRDQAAVMTEEEHQRFIDALFPVDGIASFDDAMRACGGVDSEE